MSFGISICEAPGCEKSFEKASWNSKYHSEDCKQIVKNLNRRIDLSEKITTVKSMVSEVYESAPNSEMPENHFTFLRSELTRLAKENERLKSRNYEQVQALYSGIKDGLSSLDFPKIKKPHLKQVTGEAEVAAIIGADWQLGKVTPTYNTEIAEQRIEYYTDKVIEMTNIQRSDHPVKDARIWFLGDMGEGENIFSGQASLIESSAYAQFIVDLPRIAGNMIRRLLSNFETIHFVGVPGNHGRLGTKDLPYNKESNMDRIFYKVLEYIFKDEPRITFEVPDGHGEMGFYAVDHVGNLGTLLMHGYQFKSINSISAMKTKVLGYKSGAIEDTDWDQLWVGHWHQVMKHVFGPSVFHISGSPESSNTYAQEELAAVSRPSQPIQFINPRKGIVTWEADIWLD